MERKTIELLFQSFDKLLKSLSYSPLQMFFYFLDNDYKQK